MRVLISGAGPAGLCVAYWLKRYGLTPTLIESAQTLRTGGYKIDVRGTALQVLHRMGIYQTVVDKSTDMQEAQLIDKEGKIIKKMTGDDIGHRIGHDIEIMRGVLCEILHEQIPDVEIIFDDSIEAIEQTDHEVLVNFKKGNSRNFDFIIGADGVHSSVRRITFGDEFNFAHSLGINLCVYTIPNYLDLDRIEIQYTELGRLAAIWSTRGDSVATASFAFVSNAQADLKNVVYQQEWVKSVFKDMEWEFPKFLSLMSKTDDFYFDVGTQIRMENWSKDRVVLLGDAAYCASPMSGQGLSLALVGAYVLAGEIASSKTDLSSAFYQYQQEMVQFVQLNQELGIQAAELFRSQEKQNILTMLLNKVVSIAPGKMIAYFIKRGTKRIQMAANSMALKNYV